MTVNALITFFTRKFSIWDILSYFSLPFQIRMNLSSYALLSIFVFYDLFSASYSNTD